MAEVLGYRNSFPKLAIFLLQRLILITVIGYAGLIASELMSMVGSFVIATSSGSPDYAAATYGYALSQYIQGGSYIVEIIGIGVVIQLCLRTLKVCNRVVNFDKYSKEYSAELARLKDNGTVEADSTSKAYLEDARSAGGYDPPPAARYSSHPVPPPGGFPVTAPRYGAEQPGSGRTAADNSPHDEHQTLPNWSARPYDSKGHKRNS